MKLAFEIEVLFLCLISFLGANGQSCIDQKPICNQPKFGVCPNKLINPSISCTTDSGCPGGQRCCLLNGTTNIKYCSDIDGSKENLRCPRIFPQSQNTNNLTRCYTDSNCGAGDLKCCFNEFDCTSYCQNGEKNCFNILNKSDVLCPLIPSPNSTIYCSFNEHCPGNEVCCYGTTGRKCSPPRSLKPGTCPTPEYVVTAGTAKCVSDKDCGDAEKCCKFDDCTYVCSEALFLQRSGLLKTRTSI